MKTFKLYHTARGYLCKVNTQEIFFLFGIQETDADTINILLSQENNGYYIKL